MRLVLCILLLVVYCFCISDSLRVRPTARSTCTGRWRQFCLSARGGNTDVLNTRIARAARERREVGGAGGVEGRGGEGEREGDDLGSEINDQRRQLSEEKQLTKIGNHQKHPAQPHDVSIIDRLMFLIASLRDNEKEATKQDEGRSSSDADRQRILRELAAILENKS